MNRADVLRDSIIDKLMTISDEDNLQAIFQMVNRRVASNKTVELTEEQTVMLQLSEQDIQYGRLLTQEELDKNDREWLNEQ